MDSGNKNKFLLFGFIVSLALLGWGSYALYVYYHNKTLDAMVVTPDQANAILQQGLNS